MASSALSTKALFFRIVPAGGGPNHRVEHWKKIDDTAENREKFNAVPYTDTFYDVDDGGTHKAVIFNDDLVDDEIMDLNANDAPLRGDYVKFKDLNGPYGLMDVRGLRSWIRTSTDPRGEMRQEARHPATRERIAPTDVQVILGEEAPPHLVIARLFEEDIDDAFIEENGLPPDVFSRIKNDGFQFSVTIPDGVTQIEEGAFRKCSGLLSVTIPEGVTQIGEYAFRGCSGLTSVTIPEGVTEIGFGAFYDCSGLENITIPEGVTQIGELAFRHCSGLESVTIPEGATIEHSAFSRTGLISVTISEGVTIGDSAFMECRELMLVTILERATIGDRAFMSCHGLILLKISEGVHIGDSAFQLCSGLSIVIIPKSVTMGYRPFSENTLVLTS